MYPTAVTIHLMGKQNYVVPCGCTEDISCEGMCPRELVKLM